jgi:AcrR family transcriptional regulator
MIGKVAERREARTQQILECAWELARTEGVAGFSLHALARAVGIRQPSLYEYFASKDALYDAMFAQGYQQLLEEVDRVEPTGDAVDRIHQMARVYTELAVQNVVRSQLLFQRTLPGFEPSPASYALATEFLERARERLAAAGLTEPRDLDLYTAVVSGIVNQQIANDPGGTRWVELIDDAMDMYLEHAERSGRLVR